MQDIQECRIERQTVIKIERQKENKEIKNKKIQRQKDRKIE